MSQASLISRRRLFRSTLLAAAALTMLPRAQAQGSASSTLAPSGDLRVAFNLSNSVLVSRSPQGQFSGILVDIANMLAERIGAGAKLVPYQNVVQYNRSIGKGEWDIAIVPRDLSRIDRLAFSEPFLDVENGYVAKPGSTLLSVDDVDRTGIKVAVTEHSPVDGYLSRTLKKATIVRLPRGMEEAREALTFGRADVYADYARVTELIAAEVPGATTLIGGFDFVPMTLAVPKSNAEALSFLNKFLGELKHDGTLADAIKRAALRGVRIRR